MTNEQMTNESLEKIRVLSDTEIQTLWLNLCNGGFFLADTAKKQDLLKYPPDTARTFLLQYVVDLQTYASYVEEFWRYVVKGEVFTF